MLRLQGLSEGTREAQNWVILEELESEKGLLVGFSNSPEVRWPWPVLV